MVRQRVLMVKLIVYNSGVRGLWNAPRNMIVVRAFIIMMFIYSAMKNKANGPAAYSTLNPDTSSDSPSVRSNGARFVSANVEINHTIASGHVGMMSQICSCVVISENIVNDPFISITDKTMMARDTSYEIVCAAAQSAPIRVHLEFDDQPDHRMA
jgi:hypothetical protein